MNPLKRRCFSNAILIVLLVAIAGFAALYQISKDSRIISKTENNYRIDKGPIMNRFPKLDQFEKCYWTASVIGKTGIGPSSYRLRGFIVLNSNNLKTLKANYNWSKVGIEWNPSLNTNILNANSFEWMYSPDFNKYIKSDNYVGNFYLDTKNGIIYFDVEK